MQPDIEKLARVAANEAGDAVNFDWRLVIQSILSALTEQGFVVVPEGPTEVMIEAGADYGPIGCCNLDYCDAHNIYRAMLAAHKGTAHEQG